MTKRKDANLYIEIASEPWRKLPGLKRRLEAAAALTLAVLPAPLLPVARNARMTLLLTTDKAVQKLNREFRSIDKPTNVLSFPSFLRRDLVKMGKDKNNVEGEIYVGDIAVAYMTTAKEARAEGKLPIDHLTHLTIHGILHLFGYDHDTPAKAARMEKAEREIMATLGLLDPYAPQNENDKRRIK